jgi:hypothetical protein
VRFEFNYNGNGIGSFFDANKIWPKFGGFFAKEVMVLNFTYKFEYIFAL